jgi:hypothetical protein
MNANQSLINVEFVMIYLVDIGRTNLKGYDRMHDIRILAICGPFGWVPKPANITLYNPRTLCMYLKD